MNWRRGAKIAAGVAISCILGAEAVYGAYALTQWLRYPSGPRRGRREPSPLDEFMPEAEIDERLETAVAAPADVVMASARELELQNIRPVRMLFASRAALLRARAAPMPHGPFLEWLPTLGWRLLREDERCLIFASVTQPWEKNVVFRPLQAAEFIAFDEPGFVKIAWTIRVEECGAGALCVTETRVVATSVDARRKFRRYWAVFSPGILLIRRVALRAIKRTSESVP